VARKKELDKLVRDLRKEISKLSGLLERKSKKGAVALSTPVKITLTEVRISTPMTLISPNPFRLGRKRGGGEGEGSGFLSRVVEVVEGKRRRVEEEVGTQVDPEKVKRAGAVVGLKVCGVVWLVGVEGVVEELGRLGIMICGGSRWLVNDSE